MSVTHLQDTTVLRVPLLAVSLVKFTTLARATAHGTKDEQGTSQRQPLPGSLSQPLLATGGKSVGNP